MSDTITLYDIPCKGRCAGWSANVWKARLVLNYKGLDYKTEWIEHPDITPTFKQLGLEPNVGQISPYTVPVIILSDGTAVMDSAAIASKLESMHPEPSLHLDAGLHEKLGPIIGKIGFPLVPVFMPRVPREKLLDTSVQWFRDAREKSFGMTLEQMEETKGGEKAWAAAEHGLEEMKRFLAEHKRDNGPFVLGSEVSFADFMIAALLEGFRRIGSDIFGRIVAYDDSFRRVHEACQKWMDKDQ